MRKIYRFQKDVARMTEGTVTEGEKMSLPDFIIEVQVLEGTLTRLWEELSANTIGGQGSGDRLAAVADTAYHLSEIAKNGFIEFP